MLAGTSWQGVFWVPCSLPAWERNPTMGHAGAEGSQHIPPWLPQSTCLSGQPPRAQIFCNPCFKRCFVTAWQKADDLSHK